ncbi:transcriptional regulator GcvA [Microvirga rosea]|uniref:transcriptional regulator GcvA n=1 Tax=Microvirga rosea TaxID=2715425 RepID=UPI001D09A965|nr:transcriptional regulator GcvA [Microvirga rosea]MCB8820818.1 transcriptional regulator GcvA [Microvirga rosea]
MSKQSLKLPPMSAVRVFEAAARHQSFTRAAEELGMTQAAVSYQIRMLEDRVGAPLFTRHARHVSLTARGSQLAPAVTEAFELLRNAFDGIDEAVQTTLSITTVTTVAANWLVPRLGRFQQLHPGIVVQIDINQQIIDFAKHDFDVGIRSGTGVWPGLEAHLLFPNQFTPVCSPELLQQADLRTPADLLKLPLIAPSDPWWMDWFNSAGVPQADLSNRPDFSLGAQQFEGMAAMAGQGVAMVNPFFFRGDLAAGRLVKPFDLVVTADRSYWIVYPKARRRAAKIQAFRDWLISEVAGDAEGSQPPQAQAASA